MQFASSGSVLRLFFELLQERFAERLAVEVRRSLRSGRASSRHPASTRATSSVLARRSEPPVNAACAVAFEPSTATFETLTSSGSSLVSCGFLFAGFDRRLALRRTFCSMKRRVSQFGAVGRVAAWSPSASITSVILSSSLSAAAAGGEARARARAASEQDESACSGTFRRARRQRFSAAAHSATGRGAAGARARSPAPSARSPAPSRRRRARRAALRARRSAPRAP